jgi:hypothetical protein
MNPGPSHPKTPWIAWLVIGPFLQGARGISYLTLRARLRVARNTAESAYRRLGTSMTEEGVGDQETRRTILEEIERSGTAPDLVLLKYGELGASASAPIPKAEDQYREASEALRQLRKLRWKAEEVHSSLAPNSVGGWAALTVGYMFTLCFVLGSWVTFAPASAPAPLIRAFGASPK